MSTARAASIILGKELRLELRTRQLLTATLVFALIVIVMFSYAFDPTPAESRRYGPGLLWIAFLFAGSLMLHPSFAREEAGETIDALRLAPISSFAIVLGKMAANFIFLAAAEVILVPIFSVLYDVPLAGIIGRLILVLGLGTLGLVIAGTVFAAIATHARMRELMLPLLLLPVLAPLLVAAVQATRALLTDLPALDSAWVVFLVAFDVIFMTASWLVSDFLLEE
ncbi:MAG: heme exporter protein CcmB [Candidatus Acidiferrales bacterium]